MLFCVYDGVAYCLPGVIVLAHKVAKGLKPNGIIDSVYAPERSCLVEVTILQVTKIPYESQTKFLTRINIVAHISYGAKI